MNRTSAWYQLYTLNMSYRRRLSWAALLVAAVLCGACAFGPQRIWVPTDIATQSERYEVSGHVQLFRAKVSFGPYQTTSARIGAQSGMDSDATIFNGQKERSTSRQEGSFQLRGPDGAKSSGHCVQSSGSVQQHELSLAAHDGRSLHLRDDVVDAEHHYIYRCTLKGPSASTIELVIEDGTPRLSGGARLLTLVRINRAENQAENEEHGSAHGYLIKEGTQTVAAVDMSEHVESVRLQRDLPQHFKDELATICMALLLARDMR